MCDSCTGTSEDKRVIYRTSTVTNVVWPCVSKGRLLWCLRVVYTVYDRKCMARKVSFSFILSSLEHNLIPEAATCTDKLNHPSAVRRSSIGSPSEKEHKYKTKRRRQQVAQDEDSASSPVAISCVPVRAGLVTLS